MENASKALIVAGSILIAIMIIALGVTIFNKATSSADATSLDSTEITMFNSKFEKYASTQSGSQVKSMISFAISIASTNKEEPSKLPTITYGETTATGGETATGSIQTYINSLSSIRQSVRSTTTYEVTPVYAETGLITTITITPST